MFKINQERGTGIIIWIDIQREISMILNSDHLYLSILDILFNVYVVAGSDYL